MNLEIIHITAHTWTTSSGLRCYDWHNTARPRWQNFENLGNADHALTAQRVPWVSDAVRYSQTVRQGGTTVALFLKCQTSEKSDF